MLNYEGKKEQDEMAGYTHFLMNIKKARLQFAIWLFDY